MARIDNAVISTDQLFSIILRNLTELIIHVNDVSDSVGNRHDSGGVECLSDVLEFSICILKRAQGASRVFIAHVHPFYRCKFRSQAYTVKSNHAKTGPQELRKEPQELIRRL